jgi:hypothetical protein
MGTGLRFSRCSERLQTTRCGLSALPIPVTRLVGKRPVERGKGRLRTGNPDGSRSQPFILKRLRSAKAVRKTDITAQLLCSISSACRVGRMPARLGCRICIADRFRFVPVAQALSRAVPDSDYRMIL